MDNHLTRADKLLSSIKAKLPQLKEKLEYINAEWRYDDAVYRYYHQSFKTYYAQEITEDLVKLFKEVYDEPLNQMFLDIVAAGTGIKFEHAHNSNWEEVTAPILYAMFHAKYFLEMMIKSAETVEEDGGLLDICWASTLYLYNLR